jgi:hypothetical protein
MGNHDSYSDTFGSFPAPSRVRKWSSSLNISCAICQASW